MSGRGRVAWLADPYAQAGARTAATAFLDTAKNQKYPQIKVDELKDVFRDFMRVCYIALQINERHIPELTSGTNHTVLKENS